MWGYFQPVTTERQTQLPQSIKGEREEKKEKKKVGAGGGEREKGGGNTEFVTVDYAVHDRAANALVSRTPLNLTPKPTTPRHKTSR